MLIELAERCGDAMSIYQRAADLMPPRGLNPAEIEQIISCLSQEQS